MDKKLYRSESDRMLGGVCGGFASYLNIESTILRLAFAFLGIAGGSGLLAYLICWVIIPTESSIDKASDDVIKENSEEIKETVTKTAKGIKTEVKSDTNKENNNEK